MSLGERIKDFLTLIIDLNLKLKICMSKQK